MVWRMEYKESPRIKKERSKKIFYLSSQTNPSLSLKRSFVRNTFDILSIGSFKNTGLLRAQAETFGGSKSVGYFFASTEKDDADPSCEGNLSLDDVVRKIDQCKMRWKGTPQNPLINAFRKNLARKQWLEKKANPVGWYCAQSRPPLALTKLLEHYRLANAKSGQDSLPLYLLLIDDDTYIDLNILRQHLLSSCIEAPTNNTNSPFDAVVYSGCRIRWLVHEVNFTFPYGGYGLFFSRGSLLRLMQPLYCNITAAGYEEEACRRLHGAGHSLAEEVALFRPGMSVGDLMHAYTASNQNCLHSDWNTGYFVNYYNISGQATADGTWFSENERMSRVKEARLHTLGGSELYNVKKPSGYCLYEGMKNCPSGSAVCHRLTARDMMQKNKIDPFFTSMSP